MPKCVVPGLVGFPMWCQICGAKMCGAVRYQICGARIGRIGLDMWCQMCVVPGLVGLAWICGAEMWCQYVVPCGAVVPNMWCQMCGAGEFPEISRDLEVSHETSMTSQVT